MQTKILAIQQKRRPHAIVEEALRDLLKKYKVKGKTYDGVLGYIRPVPRLLHLS
ncbi:hypothetical protein ACYX34_06620 [Nitrospira sp. CMX1]